MPEIGVSHAIVMAWPQVAGQVELDEFAGFMDRWGLPTALLGLAVLAYLRGWVPSRQENERLVAEIEMKHAEKMRWQDRYEALLTQYEERIIPSISEAMAVVNLVRAAVETSNRQTMEIEDSIRELTVGVRNIRALLARLEEIQDRRP